MSASSSARETPRLHRGFVVTAGVGGAVIMGNLNYSGVGSLLGSVASSGSLISLAFVLFATFACALGARRRDAYFRTWLLLAFAFALSSVGSAITVFESLTVSGNGPFPLLRHYAHIACAIPVLAALLAMPIPRAFRTARWRLVLDALVITLGVSLLSWVTVLGPVVDTFGLDTVEGWVMAALPAVDVLVYSVVATLGLRAPLSEGLTWGLLGGGLTVLALTDSVQVG